MKTIQEIYNIARVNGNITDEIANNPEVKHLVQEVIKAFVKYNVKVKEYRVERRENMESLSNLRYLENEKAVNVAKANMLQHFITKLMEDNVIKMNVINEEDAIRFVLKMLVVNNNVEEEAEHLQMNS